jgi:hypothetical protein
MSMNFYFDEDEVVFGDHQIPTNLLSEHLRACLHKDPSTWSLEMCGASVLFATQQRELTDFAAKSFIAGVVSWGGNLYDMWNNINSKWTEKGHTQLLREVCASVSQLKVLPVESYSDEFVSEVLSEALSRQASFHNMRTSYASKVIRFLVPEFSAVFDNKVVGETLGLEASPENYLEYSRRCRELAKLLTEMNVVHPRRDRSKWFPADIDQALFAAVKKYPTKGTDPAWTFMGGQEWLTSADEARDIHGEVTTTRNLGPETKSSESRSVCINCLDEASFAEDADWSKEGTDRRDARAVAAAFRSGVVSIKSGESTGIEKKEKLKLEDYDLFASAKVRLNPTISKNAWKNGFDKGLKIARKRNKSCEKCNPMSESAEGLDA